MGENFAELCKIISKNPYLAGCKPPPQRIKFSNQELGYLHISNKLTLNETFKSDRKKQTYEEKSHSLDDIDLDWRHEDLKILDKYRQFIRLASTLGLFIETRMTYPKITLKRPARFLGSVKIENSIIFLNTAISHLGINFIDEKYKYCKCKPKISLVVETEKFAFEGQTTSNDVTIFYKRDSHFILDEFLRLNYQSKIQSIIPWLHLLSIDIHDFLNFRIGQYKAGKISAFLILDDISFAVKFIDLSVLNYSELLGHLEGLISICRVEKATYQLYLQLNFLVKCKRIKFIDQKESTLLLKPTCHADKDNVQAKKKIPRKSIKRTLIKTFQKAVSTWNYTGIPESFCLDPKYNFPFEKDALIPSLGYSKISSAVLTQIQQIFSNHGISKESAIDVFHLLHAYKSIGLTLNTFFVQKIFSLFAGYEPIFEIFSMKLVGICNESQLEQLISLFCKTLNDTLKSGDCVDDLYNLYYCNFWANNRYSAEYLSKSISKVHLKRISHCTCMNDLKLIKDSLYKAGKVLDIKDEKVEQKLKEKAVSLLNLVSVKQEKRK